MTRNIYTFLTLIITGAALSFSACKKNEPQSLQTTTPTTNTNDSDEFPELTYQKKTAPVLFDFTSTGCPGCGSWGKPTFYDLIDKHGTDITPLAAHIKYGDPMITPESEALAKNRYGSLYTPQIWVADSNAVILSGGYIQQASVEKANRLIDQAKKMEQPSVAAAVLRESDKLKVRYGVDFDDMPVDGEYYLACYLTEDGIMEHQSSSKSNPTVHNHVIRAGASGAFGEAFTMADMLNDKSEIRWDNEFTIADNFDKEQLYVTVVLWQKMGDRYQPLNSTTAK